MLDFLIIGAQKCGTTSLYHYLTQHPQVVSANQKEVHFFDLNYSLGLEWYKRQLGQGDCPNCLYGEASPYYIFHPRVPQRVYQHFPQVKLIVLLRNPVERAISHYYHEFNRLKVETLSLEEAIAREPERLKGELEKLDADPNYYSYNHQHYTYLSRGLYLEQLQRWMKLFPKEQFLILSSEEFWTNPDRTLAEVLNFLQLSPLQLETYLSYNAGNYSQGASSPKNRILEKVRLLRQRVTSYAGLYWYERPRKLANFSLSFQQKLNQYFQEPNEKLFSFLQRDFNWKSKKQKNG
ncbi:MAG TPA: sulfotransferase domain-containing protein [Oscillatoriales cyanobacterium M59_W2019_021]|nr:sulfotransferase domain-containing protein [Oscillatoriales cyanobacterium M4454_W2019_049]HIK53256.1 sulfotransferase domain-containing protein [Oscillatoriales cyanobacterium M59_W2019_021]